MLSFHEASTSGLSGVEKFGSDSTRNSEQRPQRELVESEASRSRLCCKRLTRFIFSHIGLVGLVVVYALAGGFLFELLERHREKVNCQEAQGEQSVETTKLKQKIVAYIQYNTTTSLTSSNFYYAKDNVTVALAKLETMLYDYRTFIIDSSSKYRSYAEDCSVTNKWTFPNALLFAITVITTIGYGNITPMTWEGQICCICYATIGIPIFLLCVANISGVLGEMFRFIYAKIICRPCFIIQKRRREAKNRRKQQEERNDQQIQNSDLPKNESDESPIDEPLSENERVAVPLTVTMIIIAGYIWIGAVLFHNFEGWSLTQAGYFCFITLATIGFGDFVPGQHKDDRNAGPKLILGAIYVLFGMAILAMCFDLMQEEIVAKFRWIGRKIGIVDKKQENDDQTTNESEKNSIKGRQVRSTTISSIQTDCQPATLTQRTTVDDEKPNSGRKSTPTTNPARIHPLVGNRNSDGILHQRSVPNKYN